MSCALIDGLVSEHPLILGSGSPRRKRILEGLGLEFSVDLSQADESAVDDESPADHVRRLAWLKAATVAGRHAKGTVLGADTIVVLDNEMLGKPANPAEAVRMLLRLRGRWHDVYTGIAAFRCSDGASASGVERTEVLMRFLGEDEIAAYVVGGEPLDKAGAYAIQDCGAAIVEQVRGCFYNVVGLPVVRLCDVLRQLDCLNHVV
ncbi:Maf family protein [bacterium]|nr:Maf family protein [bacterium]